ncbi:Crp/Fnr family transcriptional regulator [Pedobacter gandavensis]|uniref:Crp/Fnr family transcriptional regulator n=1 Tax=Pedobacter gandavensis TaxID=2679963 RepID=UPI00292EDC8A|nr:Crp/Fnr family transcriptional regulator [Pedobacter gandavensis]
MLERILTLPSDMKNDELTQQQNSHQELLVKLFNDHLNFRITDFPAIKTHFHFSYSKKKEFLVEEGAVATDYFFILDGYVRTFYRTENGTEVTIDLLRKGEFASSMYSILKKVPSFEYIQCITDVLVCRIAEKSFEAMAMEDPKWIDLGMKCLKSALLKKEERILTFGKLKGKARYEQLIEEKPDLILHVPVQYLASYIGVKPESLSRIKS